MKFVFSSPRAGEHLTKDARHGEPTFLTHDGVSGDLYLDSEMEVDTLSEAVVEIRLIGLGRC